MLQIQISNDTIFHLSVFLGQATKSSQEAGQGSVQGADLETFLQRENPGNVRNHESRILEARGFTHLLGKEQGNCLGEIYEADQTKCVLS